jgi:hypothetical protein
MWKVVLLLLGSRLERLKRMGTAGTTAGEDVVLCILLCHLCHGTVQKRCSFAAAATHHPMLSHQTTCCCTADQQPAQLLHHQASTSVHVEHVAGPSA